MRLILMMLLAAGGYHYVSKSIDDQQPAPPANVQNIGTSDSLASMFDAAKALLSSAKTQAGAAVGAATMEMPPEAQAKVSTAARNVSANVNMGSSNCGEPDRYGNLKYCFNNDK